MSSQRIEELRSLIKEAKYAYYNTGKSVITDIEYDAFEDELRELDPSDYVLNSVGSAPDAKGLQNAMLTKAKHSMPMGSQAKVNSEDEFLAWCAKNDVKGIHASLKCDGASAAAYYKDGWLSQVISRGDGEIGEDITANAYKFKGLPAHIGDCFNGSVRFEVVLTIEDWKQIDPEQSKNPRNVGTGIMGRKNGHQSEFLTIYAFDLIEMTASGVKEFTSEEEKLKRLTRLGFNTVQSQLCQTPQEAVDYFKHITKIRENIIFWIDGVVLKINDIEHQLELGVTSGRPKGQIAWKFDSVGAKTVLTGVIISGGHTGALIPTAMFEPVQIGGTTVSNASLSNFDEIARLNLAIGDTIYVVKANDIIPKITHVIHRPDARVLIEAPTACPFCNGTVAKRTTHDGEDGAVTECKNPECSKKSIGKIRRWIKSLDILGIGDTILEAMVDQLDIEDAGDLYLLKNKVDALANIRTNEERGLTLGYKRANSIIEAIDAKRDLTLPEFLGSLGIDSLGKRRVELMIKSADGELSELHQWTDATDLGLRNGLLAEKAGVPNIGYQIQEGIDSINAVMDKLLEAGVTIKATPVQTVADANIKTVCISGKLNSGKKKSDYAEPLKAAGYQLVDDASAGLTYLVLADSTSLSAKSKKATKLGIAIIDEDGLLKLI